MRSLLAMLLLPLGVCAAPLEWGPLTLGVTNQTQISHLANQFRAGSPGDDTLFLLRTTVDAQLRFDGLRLQLEVADMRGYLADANTPVNGGMINPLDILQANIGWVQPGMFEGDDRLRARLGRVTLDLGSRRLLARNIFRNTINAFDGLVLDWESPAGHSIYVFAVAPVERQPGTRSARVENTLDFDEPQFESLFFGGFATAKLAPDLQVEGYVYGLDPADQGYLVTPGFRLLRPAARGALDADFEVALQMGEAAGEAHRGAFAHLSLGYTIPAPMTPRVRLMYDWASGDQDPGDGRSQRFDPLFGVARPELGPTGLYTAFTRRNLNAPGVRVSAKPTDVIDAFIDYRFMMLDKPRDAWTTAQLQDPLGDSGRSVGRQLEVRVRWHMVPKRATLDTGVTWLDRQEFAEALSPGRGDPVFAYTQLVLTL